jgi:hypothetical protein
MNKTLTLEHLASYPKDEDNGLLIQTCTRFCTGEGQPLGYKIGRMIGISSRTGVEVLFDKDDFSVDYDLNQIKPIILPLYYLIR